MKNLTLNVKKKWFDMILSGQKKEEYREIKPLYEKKFNPVYTDYENYNSPKSTIYKTLFIRRDIGGVMYDTVTFLNGMKPLTPTIVIECKGISICKAVPEWSDNWQGEVFVIKLGNIISTKNIGK